MGTAKKAAKTTTTKTEKTAAKASSSKAKSIISTAMMLITLAFLIAGTFLAIRKMVMKGLGKDLKDDTLRGEYKDARGKTVEFVMSRDDAAKAGISATAQDLHNSSEESEAKWWTRMAKQNEQGKVKSGGSKSFGADS